MRTLIRILVIVPVAAMAPSSSAEVMAPLGLEEPDLWRELNDLAESMAHCGEDKIVMNRSGVERRWVWSPEKGEWVEGHMRGQVWEGNSDVIEVWPKVHGYDDTKTLEEQLSVKAEFARTLAHECYHALCPPHAPGPVDDPGAPPGDPPDGDGRDPDCNDLNYAYHTADALCQAAQAAAADGKSEYCEELKAAHAEVQKKWNTEGRAEVAEKCACEEPAPWDPEGEEGEGDDYSACPKFPVPPGGCDGEPPYPGNSFIPDCNCECEEPQ